MHKIILSLVFLLPLISRAQVDATLAAESVRGDATAWGLKQIGEDQAAASAYVSLAIEQQVAQNAVSLGLTERMDVNRALYQARRRVLVQAMRDEVSRRVPVPTDDEVAEVYKARPNAFTLPDAYQLEVYQWNTNATAQVIKAKASLIGSFTAKDVEALDGVVVLGPGSTKLVSEKLIVPEIWKGLATMKDGAIQWYKTETGDFLVKRINFQKTRLPTLEEVRENIRSLIRQRRVETAWQEYVEGIQKAL